MRKRYQQFINKYAFHITEPQAQKPGRCIYNQIWHICCIHVYQPGTHFMSAVFLIYIQVTDSQVSALSQITFKGY